MLNPASGYCHPAYANALSEFGEPIELPQSGGWLLRRQIGNTGWIDAMGPYPLFSCFDWKALAEDLRVLQNELVSVVLVSDPFGEYDEPLLESCFDRVIPFKTHFLVSFDSPGPYGKSRHRSYANQAMRELTVEICDPGELVEQWIPLYDHLIQRHSIRGIQGFSPESFRRQFAVPGLVTIRAIRDGECVGAHLWFVQGDVAYYHLGAANERGYLYRCSYALVSRAIQHFQGQVRWLDMGGGAGNTNRQDGLTQFKEGWANATAVTYLCGRVLDVKRYQQLSTSPAGVGEEYFPAYRRPKAA